ncbi:MAG: MFS transporter [Syntrophomonas sp.]
MEPAQLIETSDNIETTENRERLPKSNLIKYAFASIGGGMMDFPLSVFLLPFYTEIVGVKIAVVSLVALIIGMYDAVTDPAAGIISDRLKPRFNGRKIALLWGAIPLGITFFWLFNPITGYEAISFFLAYFFFINFTDVVFVPYMAIGLEMTPDYHERIRVQSYSRGFWIFGLLLGIFLPIIYTSSTSDKAVAYSNMSLLISISLIVTILITYFLTRESTGAITERSISLREQFTTTFKNKHFLILFASFVLHTFAVAVQNAVFVYYSINWLEVPETDAMLALPLYLIAAIISVPIWQKMSGKIMKKNLMLLALFYNVVCSSLIFFIPRGEVIMLYAVFFMAGIGYGCTYVVPNAMLSDVIDYDEYLCGEYRAGAYFGIWEFGRKASYSFCVALTMQLLYVLGYVQQADQTLFVDNVIRAMISFLSAGFYLLSAVVLLFFKFNKDETREMRRIIRERRNLQAAE